MNRTKLLSRSTGGRRGLRFVVVLIVLLLVFPLSACRSTASSGTESESPSADRLDLTFTYGSEKEKWITEVTNEFNRGNHRIANGKRIFVRGFPMGSGEAIDEVMDGRR